MRRGKLDNYVDILLSLVEGPSSRTSIVSSSRVGWYELNNACLPELQNKALIQQVDGKRHSYSITGEGREFIRTYLDLYKKLGIELPLKTNKSKIEDFFG